MLTQRQKTKGIQWYTADMMLVHRTVSAAIPDMDTRENLTMRPFSSAIKSFCAIGLLLASSVSFAIPTINFAGNINYDTLGVATADLNITGVLGAYEDLSLVPDLGSSSISLFADLTSISSDAFTTTGTFGTSAGTDLLIMDKGGAGGSERLLLSGEISSMQFVGPNGFNLGNLAGSIQLTGGLLNADFGSTGALVAFNFNLDSQFGPDMFDSNFTGKSNGSIESTPVPEPVPLALLGIGLIGITLSRRASTRKQGKDDTAS